MLRHFLSRSGFAEALDGEDVFALRDALPTHADARLGHHHARFFAEHGTAQGGSDNSGVEGGPAFSALLSSLRAPMPKGAALLSDQGAVTPVVVYTGPTRTPAQLANLEALEPPATHKRKGAAKAATAKLSDEKVAPDGKAPTDKTTKNKAAAGAWTPTSSSALAASPPAGLETKPAADAPKKKSHKAAKADPATKPAPAQ